MSRRTFVWTEAVRDATGPPVPSVEELQGEDPVIDEFLALMGEIGEEESEEAFRDVLGMAWEPVDDHEESRPDQLPLTQERLSGLVDRAQQRVFEELALRRAE